MRRFLTATACVLAASLAGCLKTKDEATIDAKGAGTISQVYEVDLATSKQLRDMVTMFGSSGFGGGAPGEGAPSVDDLMPDVFSEKATTALAKGVEGFTLREHHEETNATKRVVKVKADFTSLEAVAKAGRFVTAGVELAKNADGSFTLTFDHAGLATYTDALKGPDGKPVIPNMPEMDLSSVIGLLEPVLSGLSIKRTVTLPGPVVETDGAKSETGNSVTWSAGYADLLGKGVVQKVTFKGEGLELKPFKYRPNLSDLYRKVTAAKEAPKPPTPPAPPTPPSPTTPTPAPETPTPAMDK